MRNQIWFILAAAFLFAPETALRAQPLTFGTLAGNAGYGWVDGPGREARFNFPQGIAADAAGNVYVADTQNNVLRRIDPAGTVTTLAGAAGSVGNADGTGAGARFAYPQGLAVGADGTIYVADTGNSTVRQVSPSGVVTTLAGSPGVIGSADGTNGAARFNLPGAVAADAAGVLYVADTCNSLVRMVAPLGTNWVVTTLAGSPKASADQDGTNQNARFSQPCGITVDTNRNLYVADTGNGAIRKIAASGTNWVTTTLVKPGVPGGVALDRAGDLYVADSGNNVIRRVVWSGTNWVASVLAGSVGEAGSVDGPQGTNAALFNYPRGIAWSANGLLYVADSLNNSVRQTTAAGVVTTLAGAAGGPGRADGLQDQARFNAPLGLAVDGGHNVYVADSQNNAIRRVTPAGLVTTLAGAPTGLAGSADGDGTNAAFNSPAAVAVDAQTNIYVADSFNNEIRKLAWAGANWVATTLAGRAGPLYAGTITNVITNGLLSLTNVSFIVTLASPYYSYAGAITNIAGVVTNLSLFTTNTWAATNDSGVLVTNTSVTGNLGGVLTNVAIGPTNIYFIVTNTPLFGTNMARSGPNRWTNVFSLATNVFSLSAAPPLLDGIGTNALFYQPGGLALDDSGNLYVADGGTNGVRVVTPDGVVTTLAASWGAYTVDAGQFGTNQLFYRSSAVAVDGAGNVYVADAANNTIRSISAAGSVATIAGSPGFYGAADGANSDARFASPAGLAIDAQGSLFVADALSHTIRQVSPAGSDWIVTTVGGLADAPGDADGTGSLSRFNHPGGVAVDGLGSVYVADTGNDTIRLGSAAIQAAPLLQCSGLAGQVVLSWQAGASAGFALETAGSLAAPGNWMAVTNVPAALGGWLWVTNSPTARAAFYRLHK
jgi:sugar lactone lactonase YvrE